LIEFVKEVVVYKLFFFGVVKSITK
jgi:hypothetical protein